MLKTNCKHNTTPEENTKYTTIYYTMKTETEPYRCPVCNGRGFVPGGFYSSTSDVWITGTLATEVCRTCQGKGVVWK